MKTLPFILLVVAPLTTTFAQHEQTIAARVQAHEWVGRELQIVVALNGSPVPVRLRTQQRLALRIGDEIAIRLNLEGAHAFRLQDWPEAAIKCRLIDNAILRD